MVGGILRYLARSDEQFLSRIQGLEQRKEYVERLRHSRSLSFLLVCLSLVLSLFTAILANDIMGVAVLLLVIVLAGFMDTDGKIRLVLAIDRLNSAEQ